MTEPQRHKLVVSSIIAMGLCLVGYWIVFGLQGFDLKSLILITGFFTIAWKIATIKRKHNPLF